MGLGRPARGMHKGAPCGWWMHAGYRITHPCALAAAVMIEGVHAWSSGCARPPPPCPPEALSAKCAGVVLDGRCLRPSGLSVLLAGRRQ